MNFFLYFNDKIESAASKVFSGKYVPQKISDHIKSIKEKALNLNNKLHIVIVFACIIQSAEVFLANSCEVGKGNWAESIKL